MKTGIYKITSPSGRVYIGQAINIQRRFREYKKPSGATGQLKLKNSFNKYGWEAHTFEIIEECEFEQLNIRERYWQDHYNVLEEGLNCILTRTDILPQKMSEETKKRIGDAQRGEKGNMWGKKHSEETIVKMKESCKGQEKGYWRGKKLSKEAVQKRVDKMIGVKQSKEHIEKRRDLRRANYILLNIQTGIYYFGYVEASDSISMNVKTFWQKVNKNKKNTTNFILV